GLGLAASRPAAAEPHKLLVLQSEGRVEAATRAKIDQAILKLALAAEPQASLGDLNFGDAATAVGCKPDTPACKDEVLAMFAVDEIVITSVTRKPGGIELSVRRVTRGGASRELATLIATGAAPDKLDAIAPLFSDAAAPAPLGPIGPAAPAPAATPAPAVTPGARPGEESPVRPPPTEVQAPAPSPVATPAAEVRGESHVDAPDPGRRRLELVGMVGGGSMVVLGFVLWGAAKGVQGDIDKAPTTTKEDIAGLRDLESRGDTYAALGNLFTVTGLVVGGISTYLFIRDRRARSTSSARLTPTVLDHGAGLVLTIGGAP
ncbi:MAG TPA: hypothetical protein VGD80_44420, partial [Kofleriaceae bacterium]